MRLLQTLDCISATNNYSNPKTWFFRAAKFSLALFVLYLVDLSELNNGRELLVVCGLILASGFLLVPVSELAFDKDRIYFIKTSIFPKLDAVKSLDISRIKRIGYYSRNPAPSVFSLFVPITDLYRIEFHFKDGSSESEDVFISKGDLKRIVSKLREEMK